MLSLKRVVDFLFTFSKSLARWYDVLLIWSLVTFRPTLMASRLNDGVSRVSNYYNFQHTGIVKLYLFSRSKFDKTSDDGNKPLPEPMWKSNSEVLFIHMRENARQPNVPFCKVSLKIKFLKLLPHMQGPITAILHDSCLWCRVQETKVLSVTKHKQNVLWYHPIFSLISNLILRK